MPIWTVDAHCHWSDKRLSGDQIPLQIREGVLGFLLGGVEPTEWKRQSELSLKFPGRFWQAFGLHPYFVARETPEVLDQAWRQLMAQAPELAALGETGLDFRKPYPHRERQRDFFVKHLALAKSLDKPVILHIVRAHEEALRELKPLKGMVHAFTAGPQLAKRYMDLGLHLSIGAKLLFAETHDLHQTAKYAPLDRLLIESDCPDQAPPGKPVHDSTTVWAVAKRLGELKKLPFERVVEQTRANLLRLINKEIVL